MRKEVANINLFNKKIVIREMISEVHERSFKF